MIASPATEQALSISSYLVIDQRSRGLPGLEGNQSLRVVYHRSCILVFLKSNREGIVREIARSLLLEKSMRD